MPTISALGDGFKTRFPVPPSGVKSVTVNGNPVTILTQDPTSVTLAVAPPANTSFIISFTADALSDVDLAAEDMTYVLQTADGTTQVWGTWFGGLIHRVSSLGREFGSTLIGHGTVSVFKALTDLRAGFFTAPAANVPTVNGDATFEFTSNTTMTLRAKGTDGTVRAIAFTLA